MDDGSLDISDIQTGDLYLNLEEKLSILKKRGTEEGEKDSYRLKKGDKQIGIIEAPLWASGNRIITADEFRERFHEIIDSLENDHNSSYSIIIEEEPAGCLMSNKKFMNDIHVATQVLVEYAKNQEHQAKKTRSWLSRLFRRG